MESGLSLHAARKLKYRFGYKNRRPKIDICPFSREKAVPFAYGGGDALELPEELRLIKEVANNAEYKNRQLATF